MNHSTPKYSNIETVTTKYPTRLVYTQLKHRILANKKPKKDLEIEIPAHIQEKMDAENLERSIRHTQKQIKDIVECNEFEWFGTFTFSAEKIDRTNPDLLKKHMAKWLNNQKRHSPNMKYLFIPERHKLCHPCAISHLKTCIHPISSRPWHFHALIGNYNGKMALSGEKDPKGRPIFNITNYKTGFTNLTHIQDKQKTANYCRKYITKDLAIEKSKKRYWSSKNLAQPEKVYNLTTDEVVQKYPVDLSATNQRYEWQNDHIHMTVLPLKAENSHD